MPLKLYKTLSKRFYKIIQTGSFSASLLAFIFTVDHAIACDLPTSLSHTVVAIKDARTLRLDDGTDLRLSSILPPTAYDSPAATDEPWPPEQVAIQALTDIAKQRSVRIALDRRQLDRYGRRIGYAFLIQNALDAPQLNTAATLSLQAHLISTGQARVVLTPDIDATCATYLLTLEATAEAARKGLWQHAAYKPRRAEDVGELRRLRSTYQIVEGTISRVAVRRSVIYLNFGTNWKRDFSAKLSRRMLRRARLEPSIIQRLTRTPVRIRGWLEKRNGPLITIWRLEQIERLTLTPAGRTRRTAPPDILTANPIDEYPAKSAEPQ